jgi:hypothetical protein
MPQTCWLQRSVLSIVCAVALAGCGAGSTTTDAGRAARAAQRATGYQLTWAGSRLAGLKLADTTRDSGSTTFVYGTCNPSGEGGCEPPLEIQVFSICDRNALSLDVRPTGGFSARGVDILNYGEGRFELATGISTVVVWAKPRLARQAIDALRPVGRPHRTTLAAARYPRYYLGQLRRVYDTYQRTHSLPAIRAELHISTSAARFELGLARGIGGERLRRNGRPTPALRDIKRAHQPPIPGQPPSRSLRAACELEPAH